MATKLELSDLANLASSGISPELAEQAKLRRVDSAEGGVTVGRNGSGDYAGILIPNILPGQTHAREYRLRRDHPDLEYKDGRQKEIGKYLTPPGRSNLAYFVPGTPADWLSDATLPVLITEGEKKALALWELGYYAAGDASERPHWLPVGLPGVWNWKGTIGKATGPDGDRRDVKGVIPDIERVNWKRRKVTIVFDVNSTSNSSVEIARVCLTNELRKRGAELFWFTWPDDTPASVNGIDDLLGLWGCEKTLKALKTKSTPVRPTEVERKTSEREFITIADDHHKLILSGIGVTFDIDRLRRERHELIGELCVHCDLPGARVINGTLSIADFNLSSARARSDRAKLLGERANTRDLDWLALIEEFCQRVLQADRNGQPGVDLRQLPRPDMENDLVEVDGLALPRRHPSILFGDGGAVKSYTGLYFVGRLAMRGVRVALFDWELVGDDHRDRLERLFGIAMPRVLYVRCERPLVYEADRLRRIVRDDSIEFCIYDSVAFASDGPPEAAEVASRYFRAVRQIGAGSLHIAHVNKSENADQKPFGCYSRDTDVLTRRGWVPHEDVTLDDWVACFDMPSHTLQWDRPICVHRYPYVGDMIELDGASINFLVTPNHRMIIKKPTSHRGWSPTWRAIEAQSLNGTSVRVPGGCPWVDYSMCDAAPSNAWARFLGWWIAEGCLNDWGPVLTQCENPLAKKMRATVAELGYEANLWIGHAKNRSNEAPCMQLRLKKATALGRWLGANAGIGARNKKLPRSVFEWPLAAREELLTALMEGDGHWESSVRGSYTTISKQLADDMQQLAIMNGWTARVRNEESRFSVLIGRRSYLELRASRHKGSQPYDGEVFCLTVPTGAYVTRRNGYAGIAGNSSFWHNGARSTWFAKRAEESADATTLRLGLFNKKANLGALRSPIGFKVSFTGDRTLFRRAAIADNPELAGHLTIRQRMVDALQRGALSVEEIAEEIEADAATVKRYARRYTKLFVVVPDGRLGLLTNSSPDGESAAATGTGGGL